MRNLTESAVTAMRQKLLGSFRQVRDDISALPDTLGSDFDTNYTALTCTLDDFHELLVLIRDNLIDPAEAESKARECLQALLRYSQYFSAPLVRPIEEYAAPYVAPAAKALGAVFYLKPVMSVFAELLRTHLCAVEYALNQEENATPHLTRLYTALGRHTEITQDKTCQDVLSAMLLSINEVLLPCLYKSAEKAAESKYYAGLIYLEMACCIKYLNICEDVLIQPLCEGICTSVYNHIIKATPDEDIAFAAMVAIELVKNCEMKDFHRKMLQDAYKIAEDVYGE